MFWLFHLISDNHSHIFYGQHTSAVFIHDRIISSYPICSLAYTRSTRMHLYSRREECPIQILFFLQYIQVIPCCQGSRFDLCRKIGGIHYLYTFCSIQTSCPTNDDKSFYSGFRSEERRVGKEC